METTMPTIKAIEARLAVADVKRSADFYSDVLGFRVGTLFPEIDPEFAILHRDGLRLQLGKRDATATSVSSESCTLCFDVSDALELHATIKTKVTIDWGPEVYWYHRREFAFKDPDGYGIIISEVTAEPVTCKES
jgi:catechol 2,3-dioxygenase-like lactoylglutathione lyase family enzyme